MKIKSLSCDGCNKKRAGVIVFLCVECYTKFKRTGILKIKKEAKLK